MTEEHSGIRRRRARRLTLQSLYQWQLSENSVASIEQYAQEQEHYARVDHAYFLRLFRGVTDGQSDLDRRLLEYTDITQEEVQKMDPLILGILRIGIYELVLCRELSVNIIIDEAVRLSKDFMHDQAHGYVNAILDQIATHIRRDQTKDRRTSGTLPKEKTAGKDRTEKHPQPRSLNEKDAIALLTEVVNRDALPNKTLLLAIGDDCACIKTQNSVSVSTDGFYAGIHFPPDVDPFLIGYRSLNAAVSDLAAMGADPTGFLLSLGLPSAMCYERQLMRLAQGLRLAALRCRTPLIGGNLAATKDLSLNMTVLGEHARPWLERGKMRPGDILFVSGTLGAAALGFAYTNQDPQELDGTQASLRAAYFCPQPRINLGRALVDLASACIDLSDGLASDLPNLLTKAHHQGRQLGARLFIAKIPVPSAPLPVTKVRALALTGGDDYELLFTAPKANRSAILNLSTQLALRITACGEITSSPDLICVDESGNETQLRAEGYQHF